MGILIDILLIYVLFSVIIFLVNYYMNLINSKDTYTRTEITNPLPIFNILMSNIADKYPVMQFAATILIFSMIGILIPFGIDHWITRSAVLPLLFFAGFPFIAKYFDGYHVSEYTNYSDLAKNYFLKFHEIVFYSYSFGTAATLLYIWGAEREMGFIFLLANLAVIAVILSLMIQKNIKSGK